MRATYRSKNCGTRWWPRCRAAARRIITDGVLLASWVGASVAAEAQDRPPPEVFSHAMDRKAAADWQASGMVRWEAESVLLETGSTLAQLLLAPLTGGVAPAPPAPAVLTRTVTADEPVWFSAVLGRDENDTAESEIRLELVYQDGGRDRLSVARRVSGSGPVCRVQIACERPSGDQDPVRAEVFDRHFDAGWVTGSWELRWQRGTLTPVRDGQPLGTCIPLFNVFCCREVRLVQTQGRSRIQAVRLRSPPPAPVTAEEQARRTQVTARRLEMQRAASGGDLPRAKQALADVMVFVRERYGGDHGLAVLLGGEWATVSWSSELLDRVLPACAQLAGRDSEEYGSLLIQRGMLSADEREAQRWSEEGLATLRRVLRRDDPTFGRRLNEVGWDLHCRNLHRAAEPLLREAAALQAETLGVDHPYHAAALNALALSQQAQGKHAAAKATFEQALAIFRKTDERRFLSDRAVVLNNLGYLLSDPLGAPAQAEPYLREALQIRRDLFGTRSAPCSDTLNNLGICYRGWRRFPEAEAAYREALDIAKELYGPRHERVADILHNLARLRLDQDDFVAAFDLAQQALEQRNLVLSETDDAGKIPLEQLRALSPNALKTVDLSAEIAVQLGDLPHVLLMFGLTKGYWEAVHGKEHPYYAAAVGTFTRRLIMLRQSQLARSLIEDDLPVLDRATAADTSEAAMTALAFSEILQTTDGDLTRARRYAERAATVSERRYGRRSQPYGAALNQLGSVQEAAGEFDAAATSFRTALELSVALGGEKSFDSVAVLTNLGSLEHHRAHEEEALRLLGRALELRWERAQAVAEAAHEGQLLTLGEEFRRCLATFLAAGVRAASDPAEAYAQVLRSKGLAFTLQRQRRATREQPELKPLFDALQQTSRRMAALDSRVVSRRPQAAQIKEYRELLTKKAKLEQALAAKSRGQRAETRRPAGSVAALRAALPADAALVDFVTYRPAPAAQPNATAREDAFGLAAFVLRRDEPTVRIDLGASQPIADAVDAWRREILRGAGGTTRGLVRTEKNDGPGVAPQVELRRLVWQPLEPHLAGVQLVLVSPGDVLARCPLAALPGQKPGTYLLEEISLVSCPVPQLLFERQGADDAQVPPGEAPRLLLVGDAQFGGTPGAASPAAVAGPLAPRGEARQGRPAQFAHLPGTAREVAQLAALHATLSSHPAPIVLRGAEATEEAVRAALPGVHYIHLATHGYFAPSRTPWTRSWTRPGQAAGSCAATVPTCLRGSPSPAQTTCPAPRTTSTGTWTTAS